MTRRKPVILTWPLLASVVLPAFAQHYVPPALFVRGSPRGLTTNYHQGLIVTTKGDSLFGHVRMMNERAYLLIMTADGPNYEKDSTVRRVNVERVIVFTSHPMKTNPPRDRVNFVRFKGRKKLYRELSDGKVSVYDISSYTDERALRVIFWGMLVVKGSEIVRLHSARNKHALTEVINRFYGVHFDKSQFKSKHDALAWLQQHAND